MSPALAFGWQVWTRHRLGLTLCAGYWLFLLILAHALRGECFPFWLVAPCSVGFGYLLAIFSIGLDARLEDRESGLPAWLWTLPLRTPSLVGWPMVWGALVLMLAWLTLAGVLRTGGLDLGMLLWWPALMLAVTLAWLQAMVWSPFPLQGLRLLIVGPLIGAAVIGPQALLADFHISEGLATGLLIVQWPIAYAAAVYGVARARRGDVPSWTWPGWRAWLHWSSATTVDRPFVSPARAQLWFEWRRCGLLFPFLLAGWSLLSLPMIPWFAQAYEQAAPIGLWLVGLLLCVPLHMALACGLEIGKLPGRDRTRPLSSFQATRPVSAAMLVRVKFETAALSTLAGWGVLLLAVLIWFALGGKVTEMMVSFDALRQRHIPSPFWISLALLIVGAILLTWLRMIEVFWLGMMGRVWLMLGGLFGVGNFIALIMFGLWLVKSPEYWPTVADLLPWLAGIAVTIKSLAAGWSLRALCRRNLVSTNLLCGALLIWLVMAGGLFGVLCWLLPRNMVPASALVLGIALVLPLTRLALAPLALDWNRHR